MSNVLDQNKIMSALGLDLDTSQDADSFLQDLQNGIVITQQNFVSDEKPEEDDESDEEQDEADDTTDCAELIEATPIEQSVEVKDINSLTPIIDRKNKDAEYISGKMKEFIDSANTIVKTAEYITNTSPDDKTITAAAQLMNAASSLLMEYNRSVLLDNRYKLQLEIEKYKAENRFKEIELKHKLKPQNIKVGEGGNVNIQNNLTVFPFSQEDIVRQLSAEEATKRLN